MSGVVRLGYLSSVSSIGNHPPPAMGPDGFAPRTVGVHLAAPGLSSGGRAGVDSVMFESSVQSADVKLLADPGVRNVSVMNWSPERGKFVVTEAWGKGTGTATPEQQQGGGGKR